MIIPEKVTRLSTIALTGTPAMIDANTAAKIFSRLCSPGSTKSLVLIMRMPLKR